MRLFNTLTQALEEFEPFDPPLVRMYVCGPTVYDETHVGHGRTFVIFDSLRRYLELQGYLVVHVQNITDVDDKIIRRANEEGVSWKEVAERYARSYFEVLRKLDVTPHVHPRVTDHIEDIRQMVGLLVSRGFAYVSHGSVYFDITSYRDYGRLSRLPRESWRQEEEVLQEKRNPSDFALWKRAKQGEPSWDSEWGPGRPGWHIECSTMSTRYLGTRIDIHAGGSDLVFPHHENERAQSECAFGVSPWVKYWLHAGMVTIRGEKMSKSLGNIVTLRDALSRYGPEALRLWYLSAHYRAPLDYSDNTLEQYVRTVRRLREAYQKAQAVLRENSPEGRLDDVALEHLKGLQDAFVGFRSSLDDDFNTPLALRYLHEATNVFWKSLHARESYSVAALYASIMEKAIFVFRIFLEPAAPSLVGLEEDLLRILLDMRRKLREQRLYALADEIRERLRVLGVMLYDRGMETEYRVTRRGAPSEG